jgi:Tfp pilus assembly protein PilF
MSAFPHTWSSWTRHALAAIPFALAMAAGGCVSASQPGVMPADQRSVAEYDLGRDAFHHDKLRESLEHVEKALALDAQNSDAAHLGAIVMLAFCVRSETSSDCRYEEAEVYARKAIAASPDLRDAKNTLGVILIHEGKLEEAMALLKPLANDILYGSPEKSWGNLGWAYLEHGDLDAAIDALGRAVAVQPLFCAGHYRLGVAFERKGQLAAADEAITKALETDAPECKRMQDAYEARARVGAKLGRSAEARADLEKCRELASATPVGKRCSAALGGAL